MISSSYFCLKLVLSCKICSSSSIQNDTFFLLYLQLFLQTDLLKYLYGKQYEIVIVLMKRIADCVSDDDDDIPCHFFHCNGYINLDTRFP